jgi:hypothetical protein
MVAITATAASRMMETMSCVSEIKTNSGEAESDGNQECKRKQRTPHGHVPPAADIMDFIL